MRVLSLLVWRFLGFFIFKFLEVRVFIVLFGAGVFSN